MEEEIYITEEDKALGEEQEARSRSIFDPHSKTLNMNKRITDLRENTKENVPKALKPREEGKLDVRIEGYRETFKKNREAHCKNEKGRQRINLTTTQADGLKSF